MSNPLAAIEELKRRGTLAQSPERLIKAIRGELFDRQLAVLDDPSHFRTMLCGRRAGKTKGLARMLVIKALEYPGEEIPCIEVARTTQATKTMWRELEALDKRHRIGAKFDQAELSMTLPNGSRIPIVGAATIPEADKLRGGKYPFSGIDESGAFRASVLEYLIQEVVEPALADLNGSLILAGTPTAAAVGPFYDATAAPNPGWSQHAWDMTQNPHIPHAAEWIAELLKRRGWGPDHPTFLREYRAKWVRDPNALVYRYDAGRNLISAPTHVRPNYVIGIDLGFVDATAWVVMSWSHSSPHIEVIESFRESGLIPSKIAEITFQLRERYPNATLIADHGGLGKSIIEEMRQRHGLPVQGAEKTTKRSAIEWMNGDLEQGRIKVVQGRNNELVEEWALLQWSEDRSKEDPRFENHCSDAALYCYRECRQWTFKPPAQKPANPHELIDAQVEAHIKSLMRPKARKYVYE